MQKRNLILFLVIFLCTALRAQVAEPVGGNTLWLTKSGEQYLNRLLEDLDGAQSTIEMEYYWFDADKAGNLVRDVIIRKAQEGVRVRILVDNLITPGSPEFFFERMRKAGADVRYVHDFEKLCPAQSVAAFFGFRDHRKIVIIDGRIAYTGGINFNNQTIYVWHDMQVRIEGPARRRSAAGGVRARLEGFDGWHRCSGHCG